MKKESQDLVRELGLSEALAIGLGTMIGAGIFVLSALAARDTGPAAAFSYIIAGLIVLPSALNVSELATGMPAAGGSYHLISRALGPFAGAVVGPGNWIGLTFATGFYILGFAEYVAYFLPIPTEITVIVSGILFILLNILGAKVSGKAQNFIVLILVAVLALFIIRGVFNIDPVLHTPFVPHGWGAVLAGVGLIIVSFTGFEEVSTLAAEIKKPGKNLPLAIIGAVIGATILYGLVLYVSTGVMPYADLVNYQAPLVEVSRRFMSQIGVIAMSIAALFATASSANAAIFTSSRINYAMGRDQILPGWFNKIHPKFKTPHRSVIVTGIGAVLLALSGQAEVLAEISATLYMITYALLGLSVIIMRTSQPSWYQPKFRVPLYPILPVAGGLLALGVIITMDRASQIAALVFIALSIIWYLIWGRRKTGVEGSLEAWVSREHPFEVLIEEAEEIGQPPTHEIVVAISAPENVPPLMQVALALARGDERGRIFAVNIVEVPHTISLEAAAAHLEESPPTNAKALKKAESFTEDAPVPIYVHQQPAYGAASGLISLVENRENTRLVLLEWHDPLRPALIRGNVAKRVIRSAPTHVAVLLDRDVDQPRRILIPEGGGPHARLGLRLAHDLLPPEEGRITVLRVISPEAEDEDRQRDALEHLIRDELGEKPNRITTKICRNDSVVKGITEEGKQEYDLVIIGASEQWAVKNWLVGNKPDRVAEGVPCSVLMIRKWEPKPVSWFRRVLENLRSG
jgi:amino acid transporter/nucleotide-binding universal stress UspA family protein